MNPWVAVPTFFATLSWVTVVVIYQTRAKWWKSAVGINTMGISLTLSLVLLRLALLQLGVVFDAWGNIAFGIGAYLALGVFGAQRVYLINEAQKEVIANQKHTDPPHNRRHDDPQ